MISAGSTPPRAAPRWSLWAAAILVTYAAGFAAYPSRVFIASDEILYVEQAAAFAGGRVALPGGSPAEPPLAATSVYPPGTSLLQAPLVRLGGWRAAGWLSFVCLTLTVWIVAAWLRAERHPPLAALLVPGFAPTLVFGRLATSDVPSAAIAAAGLWLFWTGEGVRGRWLAAGILAGTSLLFRETVALLFIPFFVSAAMRRAPGWPLLLAGLATGIAIRLVLFHALFGSAFYMRDLGWGWSLAAPVENLWIYSVILLVFVPGGLLAVARYRGKYRGALVAAVAAFIVPHLFYEYSAQASGILARLAIAGRFFIPLVPLLAIPCAAGAARLLAPPSGRAAILIVSAALLVAAWAVHPVLHAWSARDASVVADLYASTADGAALVTEVDLNRKYVSPLYGSRNRVSMLATPAGTLGDVLERHDDVYIVIVSRTDTALLTAWFREVDRYLDDARRACRLDPVGDQRYDGRRLRVFKVAACRSAAA